MIWRLRSSCSALFIERTISIFLGVCGLRTRLLIQEKREQAGRQAAMNGARSSHQQAETEIALCVSL